MNGRVLSFADVVGDEEEFFRTYFNKKVLYRPRGITGDPRQILSIADMDDIVHQEGMRSSLLRMLGNGVPAIGEQLTAKLEMRREGKTIDDAVDPGRIYAHFRSGKTLIHGGLNLTRPNLRALARSMTDRFAAKSEVVAFLTPAGQRGSTHSDPTDVYVIQLEGTKRWQIWPTPQVRRPGDDKGSFPSLPDPILDVSLQPGDVLYVPHNTPHCASAEGSVSLHVTVVTGPRTWAHHLLSAVQDILHNGPEFWDTHGHCSGPKKARRSAASSAGASIAGKCLPRLNSLQCASGGAGTSFRTVASALKTAKPCGTCGGAPQSEECACSYSAWAAVAPERVNQYRLTVVSSWSRSTGRSVHSSTFSAIQASCSSGESVRP